MLVKRPTFILFLPREESLEDLKNVVFSEEQQVLINTKQSGTGADLILPWCMILCKEVT
jgi:hypothetical protein